MRNTRIRKAFAAALMCGVLTLTACSTAWTGQAEQIVAALIPATANIVTLVATLQGAVSTADLQMVNSAGNQAGADLQLLQSLMTQYEKANVAAQPGLLSQIQSALGAVDTTMNGLLPALHIKDAATQAKIGAALGVLLSEVQSVAAIVPLAKSGASPAMTAMAARQVKKQAPLSASEFVASYNATITAKSGNAELDHTTAGLRIHSHRKFARWASLGLLK
jgi:hypothetical protein